MRWLIISATMLITACGDNGGTSATDDAQPGGNTDTATTSLLVSGDTSVAAGDSVGLVVLASDGSALSDINWTLVDYPAPLAPHSHAIGFDAVRVGTVAYEVTATTSTGKRLSVSGEVFVKDADAPLAVARLTQEVTELGKVSLRVDASDTKNVVSIDWLQTDGPAVTLTYSEGRSIDNDVFFQAPSVDTDTTLTFIAHVTFDDGTQAEDTVWVVVNDTPIIADAFFPGSDLYPTPLIHPYRQQSPWADALQSCIYTATLAKSCSFDQLPLLGQQTLTPTVDDIMNRTLVSHSWMGDAFKTFLNSSEAGPDIINLLRATTAVVISSDIRPSFYWSATGAIYLDADNFWLTSQQRDTVNAEPDYRSGFGDPLMFRTSWRYIKANADYYPVPGLARSARTSRTAEQLDASLTWLLYHELAHANDVFPSTSWSSIKATTSPLRYANNHRKVSDTLSADFPLTSERLKALAQVSYGGAQSTQTQRAYSADDIAMWFEQDTAVSMYGYYTAREDFATLFERFMMLYRLGIDADIGIFTAETIANGELLLTWGQRNRVNAQTIQPRVAFVVNNVLPALDPGQIQSALPGPFLLSSGESWQDTITSTPGKKASRKSKSELRVTSGRAFERHLPLPEERF